MNAFTNSGPRRDISANCAPSHQGRGAVATVARQRGDLVGSANDRLAYSVEKLFFDR